jgi:hypothetical protein
MEPTYLKLAPVLSSVVYSFLGLIFFGIAFWVMNKLSSVSLRKELLDEHNIAMAIVIAAVVLAQGLIIASAIH